MPILLSVFKTAVRKISCCTFSALFLLILCLTQSCSSPKNVLYFNVKDDTSLRSFTLPPEPVIQKNDILNINISSLSPEASSVFNSAASANSTAGGAGSKGPQAATGYLVSPDGTIQMPVLGMIQAAGLTKNQLKTEITNMLNQRKLLVDPIVNVQFANLRVIMLGEVSQPGVVSFPNERMSILEAIGEAGDLPLTARKDNVLLIREENGRKMFRHLDLTSSKIFSSPYFYLKSNDILYVEPTQNRVKAANETRISPWISLGLSAVSIVLGLYYLFTR